MKTVTINWDETAVRHIVRVGPVNPFAVLPTFRIRLVNGEQLEPGHWTAEEAYRQRRRVRAAMWEEIE